MTKAIKQTPPSFKGEFFHVASCGEGSSLPHAVCSGSGRLSEQGVSRRRCLSQSLSRVFPGVKVPSLRLRKIWARVLFLSQRDEEFFWKVCVALRVHSGCLTHLRNPRCRSFVMRSLGNLDVLDIRETRKGLVKAYSKIGRHAKESLQARISEKTPLYSLSFPLNLTKGFEGGYCPLRVYAYLFCGPKVERRDRRPPLTEQQVTISRIQQSFCRKHIRALVALFLRKEVLLSPGMGAGRYPLYRDALERSPRGLFLWSCDLGALELPNRLYAVLDKALCAARKEQRYGSVLLPSRSGPPSLSELLERWPKLTGEEERRSSYYETYGYLVSLPWMKRRPLERVLDETEAFEVKRALNKFVFSFFLGADIKFLRYPKALEIFCRSGSRGYLEVNGVLTFKDLLSAGASETLRSLKAMGWYCRGSEIQRLCDSLTEHRYRSTPRYHSASDRFRLLLSRLRSDAMKGLTVSPSPREDLRLLQSYRSSLWTEFELARRKVGDRGEGLLLALYRKYVLWFRRELRFWRRGKRGSQRRLGRSVIFVGTKIGISEVVRAQAKRCHASYVSDYWVGGTLTNWTMTRKRVSAYLNNKGLVVESTASKREIRAFYRKRKRVTKGIIGLVHTPKLPKVMIVVDTGHEMDALREAKKAGLMTIAIGDQSSDMRFVDVFIPGNVDDELSVNFLLSQLGLVIA